MDTYVIQRRCIIVIILLGVVAGVSGFLDLTCFSAKPRIDIYGDDDMFIGGYKGGSDTGATVTFGRTSNTGTSSNQLTLPPGSSEKIHHVVPARLLDMPQTGGVNRIGAFYCSADNGVESITTIIMSTSSVIRPREISQTVSYGEPVSFVVDKNADVPTLRWRHNGNYMWELDDQNTFTIPIVTTAHAGVYECNQSGRRGLGVHAIFLLVVRACPSGRWGTTCNQFCPVCRNGGVCDERSGMCVCAPGFSGTNCQTVHGRNRWGQDGQLRCSGEDDHGYGCQRRLFCLPHPYGCSCAAGFKGLDCNQECDEGTFGANCKLPCNCAPSVSCLKDTGECNGGQCHPDWYGVNCQERCPTNNLQPISNLQTFANGNSIYVEWEHDVAIVGNNDPCSSAVDYIVEYSLSILDSCYEQQNAEVRSGLTTNKEYTISGLLYYSTYEVNVTARRRMTKYVGTTAVASPITGQAVPTGPPLNVIATDLAADTIRFEWFQPKCGERHGQIVAYSYSLVDSSNEVISSGMVSSAFILIDDLKSFKNYTFSVSALTEIGSGPASGELIATTKKAVPSAPTNLTFTNISKDSMDVTWRKPRYPNGVINGYSVFYFVIAKPYDLSFSPNLQSVIQKFINNNDNQLRFKIEDLLPSTRYQVRVTASSDVGHGDNAVAEQFTLPANTADMIPPDMSSFAMSISEITSSTVIIQVPESDSEFATGYQIGVKLQNKCTCDKELAPADDLGHYSKNPNSYVAAELPKQDILTNPKFIIGDNNTYGLFYNPPLQHQATYSIYVGLISRINETIYGVSWSEGADLTLKSSPSDNCTPGMASSSFCPAFVVVSVLLFILLTISLTMTFKIRSMKKTIKMMQSRSKITVADTNVKKQEVASGQVAMSSDGYVEYKVSHQEDSTYQDLGGNSSEKQQGNESEYAYVNESMIKESKTENDNNEECGK